MNCIIVTTVSEEKGGFVEIMKWAVSQKEELNYENNQTMFTAVAKLFHPDTLVFEKTKTKSFNDRRIYLAIYRQNLREVASALPSEEIPV